MPLDQHICPAKAWIGSSWAEKSMVRPWTAPALVAWGSKWRRCLSAAGRLSAAEHSSVPCFKKTCLKYAYDLSMHMPRACAQAASSVARADTISAELSSQDTHCHTYLPISINTGSSLSTAAFQHSRKPSTYWPGNQQSRGRHSSAWSLWDQRFPTLCLVLLAAASAPSPGSECRAVCCHPTKTLLQRQVKELKGMIWMPVLAKPSMQSVWIDTHVPMQNMQTRHNRSIWLWGLQCCQ